MAYGSVSGGFLQHRLYKKIPVHKAMQRGTEYLPPVQKAYKVFKDIYSVLTKSEEKGRLLNGQTLSYLEHTLEGIKEFYPEMRFGGVKEQIEHAYELLAKQRDTHVRDRSPNLTAHLR